MPPNIPGSTNLEPGAYSETTSNQTGVAFPGGSREAVLMGEGTRTEVLISSAQGQGLDGLNSEYTSSTGSDGSNWNFSSPFCSNI